LYYNDTTIIYYNGEFVKAAEAKGNLYDQSLHYGYAVFEGIRAYATGKGTKIFKAREHFERMEFSCKAVRIPYPFDNNELIEISYEVLKRNNLTNAYLRPLVSSTPNMALTGARGSHLVIAAWDWAAYMGNNLLRLKTSSFRKISPNSIIVQAKVSGHYINSILATQEAKDLGFDDALLLDVDGFVAEGSGANLFIEDKGTLYTPASTSIFSGITKATVIDICHDLGIEVTQKQVTLEDVHGRDSAFFCGTGAEIVGIESLDNKPFKKDWKDSLGSIVQQAYKNLVVEKQSIKTALVA